VAITPVQSSNNTNNTVTQAISQPKHSTPSQHQHVTPNTGTGATSTLQQKPTHVADLSPTQTATPAPKPVPNSQGQTTGQIVHTTA